MHSVPNFEELNYRGVRGFISVVKVNSYFAKMICEQFKLFSSLFVAVLMNGELSEPEGNNARDAKDWIRMKHSNCYGLNHVLVVRCYAY